MYLIPPWGRVGREWELLAVERAGGEIADDSFKRNFTEKLLYKVVDLKALETSCFSLR